MEFNINKKLDVNRNLSKQVYACKYTPAPTQRGTFVYMHAQSTQY